MEEVLKGKTLLVVDDENDLRDIVASELEYMGARAYQAENILKAQQSLAANPVDLIISDIRMPGGSGVDLLEKVKKQGMAAPPMILITGFADITLEDAFDKGAEALLNKPFKLDDLIKVAERYTKPLENRFSENVVTEKSLTAIPGTKVYCGRGGASIEITNQGKRFNIGEALSFEIQVGEHQLKGKGICRWIKSSDSNISRVFMGLEFIYLDPESLANYKTLFAERVFIPFIPNITL